MIFFSAFYNKIRRKKAWLRRQTLTRFNIIRLGFRFGTTHSGPPATYAIYWRWT